MARSSKISCTVLRYINALSQRLYTGRCTLFNIKRHFRSLVVVTGIQRCSHHCNSRFTTHGITHQVLRQFRHLVLLEARTCLEWPVCWKSLSSSRRLFLLQELINHIGRVFLGMCVRGRLNGSCIDINYWISILDRLYILTAHDVQFYVFER